MNVGKTQFPVISGSLCKAKATATGAGWMLAFAKRYGQRCGGPVLLASLVVGFRVVELDAKVLRRPTQET